MSDKETAATTSASQPITVNVTTPNRADEAAKNLADAAGLEMDKTVVGGKYVVNGKTVNADGDPIKNEKAESEPAKGEKA